MLVDADLSGLPAFLTPKPGLNSGFMLPQVTRRGARVGEQAARDAGERGLDSDLREPGRSRLDGRARRASPAADGAECESHRRHRAARRRAGLRLPPPAQVERGARSGRAASLRDRVPTLDDDRYLHTDLNEAIDLVHEGTIVKLVSVHRRCPACRIRARAAA